MESARPPAIRLAGSVMITFNSLLIIGGVAIAVPLLLGLVPAVKVPAVVLEILGGVLVDAPGHLHDAYPACASSALTRRASRRPLSIAPSTKPPHRLALSLEAKCTTPAGRCSPAR